MADANGLHLSLVVAGENTYDIMQVADTLDTLQTGRPDRRFRLYMNNGYEAEWLEAYMKSRSYESHTQSRKEELEAIKSMDFKAQCCVIERAHSWMNRFRSVLTRRKRKQKIMRRYCILPAA